MILTFTNFSQKLAQNQTLCVRTWNISSLSHISSTLLFLESLRATASVELSNFQDLIQKSNFYNHYIKRNYLHLPEKLAGKLDKCVPSYNIRSLVDILVLSGISEIIKNYCFKKIY